MKPPSSIRLSSSSLLRGLASVGLFAALNILPVHAETRTWTSADGKRTFEGELLSYDPESGNVGVRRSDGLETKVHESKLSAGDIEFLKANGTKVAEPTPASSDNDRVVPGNGGNGDEAADTSKPVKVFILMGQSNMLGFGKTLGADNDKSVEYAVKKEGLYPFLVDADGNWRKRMDVRNVRVMVGRGGGMGVHMNDWLTIGSSNIGPEIGIGHHLGNLLQEPVLILKSCIGNRSLGWDLLPPGSEPYDGQPGYRGTPEDLKGNGEIPAGAGWYAGKQYDDDVANAKAVLADLGTYYPNTTKYEVAGFFWWQGDKDRYKTEHAANYEKNLVQLIAALRKDFEAPNAPFVLATLGQTSHDNANGNDGLILEGMLAVDGEKGKHPEFKGNVATVYTHPLSKGGASNGHYNGHGQTYMNVGLGMGEAMVRLLTGKR